MAELDNVKIGDKLFVFNNFMKDIEIVERLTKTLVITKSHRFVKNTGLLYGCDWNILYARPASEQDELNIKEEKRHAELVRAFKHINYSEFSTSQLESIISFIKKIKSEL